MIQFCSWHFTGICGVKWIWEGKGRLRKGNSDGIRDVSFWAFPVPTDLSWGLSVSNLLADRKESLIDHTIVKKANSFRSIDRSINQSINQSIIEGYVPEPLKQSDVVPVPKCSPPKSVVQLDPDLRPISLMSHLAKIVDGFTLSTLLNQVCDKLVVYRFAPAEKSTTHARSCLFSPRPPSVPWPRQYLRSCILCWFQQRILLGGPQHSSSRVAAPRRTRSWIRSFAGSDLLICRSSAASKTVEGSHKERN